MRGDSPFRNNKTTMIGPNLLLVEGPDEFEFFRFLRPREDVQIHAYGGKDQLGLELKTIQAVEGFDRLSKIVIVRDADTDANVALRSVLNQWAEAFEETTPRVDAERWFTDGSGRGWAVWIMPDASSMGDLEELIWRAVPETGHRSCVESLMDCLASCEPRPYGGLGNKAKLYSWLASHKEPVRQLHAALNPRNRLFDRDHPAFAHHLDLIDSL